MALWTGPYEYPDDTPVPETAARAAAFARALVLGARASYAGPADRRDRDAAEQVAGLARHARRVGRGEIAEAYEAAAAQLLGGGRPPGPPPAPEPADARAGRIYRARAAARVRRDGFKGRRGGR